MPATQASIKALADYRWSRQLAKMRRLVDNFHADAAQRKEELHSDERLMDEQDIDEYIESLKNAKIDEESVAHVLLKWLQLKKKYADVTADKSAELDMEAFKRHAKTDD